MALPSPRGTASTSLLSSVCSLTSSSTSILALVGCWSAPRAGASCQTRNGGGEHCRSGSTSRHRGWLHFGQTGRHHRIRRVEHPGPGAVEIMGVDGHLVYLKYRMDVSVYGRRATLAGHQAVDRGHRRPVTLALDRTGIGASVMGSGRARQYYCRCGTHLAKDNTEHQCARCQRDSRDKLIAPPQVPTDFWQTEQFRDACAAQHMGRVARVYRTHPYHCAVYGPGGISQTLLGQWLGLRQPQVSQIETGPPIRDLDTLAYWARLLRMPAELLWFDLPNQSRQDVLHKGPVATNGTVKNSDATANWGSPGGVLNRSNHPLLLSTVPEIVIAHLREQWHLLVRADNLFGPVRVLRLAHEQIELIESLLRDARDGIRSSLLSLGAEYAESAAWLHEDADDQTAAFWTSRALEWAHAAGDHRLLAWALFRRSQQVANEGDAAQVIGLARAAQGTGSGLSAQMRAAITQQEAYGLALEGDETACQRKLDEALRWAAPADLHGDARSGHGAFCTASYIELQRAKCWQTLGRPQQAVPTYKAALAGLPAAYNRDRAMGLAQLAGALVAVNEPEHAASVASEALAIVSGCGSGRTLRRIRTVSGQLRPHAKLPSVAQLFADLTGVEQ